MDLSGLPRSSMLQLCCDQELSLNKALHRTSATGSIVGAAREGMVCCSRLPRGLYSIRAKYYRSENEGIRKSSLDEFSDIKSIRQCFSCTILTLFRGSNRCTETATEKDC